MLTGLMQGPPAPISRQLAIVVTCLTLLLSTLCAHAQSTKDLERAEARATEGKAYFKSKLYGEAAEAFMDAYAIVKKPTLVYNAARAREEMQDNKRALALFSLYLTLPGVKSDGKRAADKHIAKLQAKVKAAEAAEARKEQEAKRQAEQDRQRRAEAEALRDSKGRPSQPPGQRAPTSDGAVKPDNPRPFPLWRATGAGALGLFAIGSQVLALQHADNAKLDSLTADSKSADVITARDDAQRWQVIAIGSGVVAAALAGWAAWNYWLATDATDRQPTALYVIPSLDGGVRAGLRLGF